MGLFDEIQRDKHAETISGKTFFRNIVNEGKARNWCKKKLVELYGINEGIDGWMIDPIDHHIFIGDIDKTIIIDDKFLEPDGMFPMDVIIDIAGCNFIINSNRLKDESGLPVRIAGRGTITLKKCGQMSQQDVDKFIIQPNGCHVIQIAE